MFTKPRNARAKISKMSFFVLALAVFAVVTLHGETLGEVDDAVDVYAYACEIWKCCDIPKHDLLSPKEALAVEGRTIIPGVWCCGHGSWLRRYAFTLSSHHYIHSFSQGVVRCNVTVRVYRLDWTQVCTGLTISHGLGGYQESSPRHSVSWCPLQ